MKKDFIKIGSLSLPRITIGRGMPKVLITAGIHGDEFSQQLVLKKLLKTVDIPTNGTIEILPRVNPLGLQQNMENNPIDNLNINRVFPGDDNSPQISKRIAALLMKLANESDAVIDLHNFTDPALSQTIFVENGDDKTKSKSMEMCQSMNIPLVWNIEENDPGMIGAKNTFIFNVVKNNISAIGVELTPLDEVKESEIEQTVMGLQNVIRLIMTGKNQSLTEVKKIKRVNVKSLIKGVFIPSVNIGKQINKNDIIGKIINSEFNEAKVISDTTGLLTRIKRPGPVSKKELIANIGK